MPNLSSLIKSIRDIMREDRGLSGDGQRIEQLAWMLFLKYFQNFNKINESQIIFALGVNETLELPHVLKVHPFFLTQFGSPIETMREFGGKERFLAAVKELEGEIYRAA